MGSLLNAQFFANRLPCLIRRASTLTTGRSMNIKGARLVLVGNSRHMVIWDQPAQFNRFVLQFLDEQDGNA